jgi:hypothetical protein
VNRVYLSSATPVFKGDEVESDCHNKFVLKLLTLLIACGWGLEVPKGLNVTDQERVLEVVGLGVNSRFLSKAYPLGGYSGLEVSLGVDSVETSDLSQLGTSTNQPDSFVFPTITVGKGIYNNSDIYFHFVPPSKTVEIAKFGVSLRWSFYQALFLPINFSVVVNADTARIKQQLSTRNIGTDLVMGLTLAEFSFYLGGGYVTSRGDFVGGINGLTASQQTETRQAESHHFMFGATYNFEPFFLGVSLNRYVTSVYSLKTGLFF